MWSNATAITLVGAGVRVATSWDIAAVHRLLFGGWRAEPAKVWAQLHDLALDAIPTTKPLDLFSDAAHEAGSPEEPVRRDGYLRPDWAAGGWSTTAERLARWAELAMSVAELQRKTCLPTRPRGATVRRRAARHTESAAELLCAELSVDGLPIDRSVAEDELARRGSSAERPDVPRVRCHTRSAHRDAEVLRHAPGGSDAISAAPVR